LILIFFSLSRRTNTGTSCPERLFSSCHNYHILQGLFWCTLCPCRILQLYLSEISTENRVFCCH